jgi:hypothetical protein
LVSEGLHISSGVETLSAVVIGAVLATVGGLVATQVEAVLRRRERERSAAMLFGEILSVIEVIVAMADEARGRGDPYGPFTLRLMRAARREAEAYDRNREALYEMRDARIRARIHTVMVRLTLILDAFEDASGQIAGMESTVLAFDPGDPAIAEVLVRFDAMSERREGAFEVAIETVGLIRPILDDLQPIAKQTFDVHASVVRSL